jgi:hypothetical protein
MEKIRVICKRRHLVDQDDDGTERYAEVGEEGLCEAHPHAWSILWPKTGAWGFYDDAEMISDVEVP